MTTVYFDWSIRNGVFTLADNEEDVVVFPNLEAVLDCLTVGDTLVGEATFESFNLEQREKMMDLAASRGVAFLTTPSRLTSRARRRHGFGDKSDETDVRAIRALAAQTDYRGERHHLKPPALPDPEWIERRELANRHLMTLRSSGTLTPAPRTPNRFNFHSAKDAQANRWADRLPNYEDLTQVQRLALGNGKDYSLIVVAAVGVAALYARTVDEFDRLAGLHAHAYPSQIRADLHHWAWAGGGTRAKLEITLDGYGKRIISSPTQRLDGLTWSQYRRSLRWLYRTMKEFV